MMEVTGYRPRVNGKAFPSHVNHDVILLATVVNVDSNGKIIRVKTSDGHILMVTMLRPLTEPIKDCIVEFEGKITSKNAMQANLYTIFPAEMARGFNFDQYNEMITLTEAEFVKNNYIIEDVSEHHGSGADLEIISNSNENRDEGGEFGDKSFVIDDLMG